MQSLRLTLLLIAALAVAGCHLLLELGTSAGDRGRRPTDQGRHDLELRLPDGSGSRDLVGREIVLAKKDLVTVKPDGAPKKDLVFKKDVGLPKLDLPPAKKDVAAPAKCALAWECRDYNIYPCNLMGNCYCILRCGAAGCPSIRCDLTAGTLTCTVTRCDGTECAPNVSIGAMPCASCTQAAQYCNF